MPPEYADLWVKDRDRRGEAYRSVMAATRQPVPWADDAHDDLVARLRDADNHHRAIAAQLLCNLAAHEPDGRMPAGDLAALIEVTRDPRFVTARHALRSLWRIGLAGAATRHTLLEAIARRGRDSGQEKNGTLIRSDIVETLRQLYDAVPDEAVRATARTIIDAEPAEKYRKKYAKFWA